MTINRHGLLVVPLVLAAIGWFWMEAAVSHFEEQTGRQFYGLAGHHYTRPESGFEYHPRGEVIHRMTTKLPVVVTLTVILLSMITLGVANHRSGLRHISLVVSVHLLVAFIFIVIAVWYEINVTGVFI